MSLDEFKARQGEMMKEVEGSQASANDRGSQIGRDAAALADGDAQDADAISKAPSQISKPV